MGVTQRGDWKTWLLYMLDAVTVTANLTYHKINDIVGAKEAILKRIRTEAPEISKPQTLVEMIFSQPFSKVKHFQEDKIYAENTARNYLNKLTIIGVLEKKTVQGHHYYLNIELYRILSE